MLSGFSFKEEEPRPPEGGTPNALLEDEPRSQLDPARLENIAVARLYTEVTGIVEIGVRRGKTTTIEDIEELAADFQRRFLSNARLFENA